MLRAHFHFHKYYKTCYRISKIFWCRKEHEICTLFHFFIYRSRPKTTFLNLFQIPDTHISKKLYIIYFVDIKIRISKHQLQCRRFNYKSSRVDIFTVKQLGHWKNKTRIIPQFSDPIVVHDCCLRFLRCSWKYSEWLRLLLSDEFLRIITFYEFYANHLVRYGYKPRPFMHLCTSCALLTLSCNFCMHCAHNGIICSIRVHMHVITLGLLSLIFVNLPWRW